MYPASAQAANVEGKVVVKFVVNEDSSITNATVVKPVNPALDSAAVKVFSSMPPWKPGKHAGKEVKVY
ncbi:MAG: TonB family protein [Flavipsychrobacter sp.]|nr:TonB family protein [Flavipsychrobacter sp.]